MRDLTVLVNSCDAFADCWPPFFQLLRTFWPDCPYRVILNTERLTHTVAGLDLRASRVAADETRRLTWSECLARCLDGIDTPYILYLQEDFFLEAPVRADWIETFLAELREGRADVVRLMECGGSGPWQPTDDPYLWEVDRRARYRVALQAALWRKDTLRAGLRAHESAWQFEVFGSGRSRRRPTDLVMCAARDRFHGVGREIVPYQPTGVVKGRWERDIVVPLFARHDIAIDFARRGFYDQGGQQASRAPLARRLLDRARSFY